jgi:hypothetical protein
MKPQREPRDRSIDDLNAAYRALDNLSGPDAKKERERIGQEIIAKTRQLYGGEPAPTAAPADSIPQINSQSEWQALPKGSRYKAPDGSLRVKQ